MKNIYYLFIKELKLLKADKIGISLTYIVPVFLILIFGSIFGGSDFEPSSIRLAFINNSKAPIAKKIEQSLDSSKAFNLIRTYKEEEKVLKFDTNSVKKFIKTGKVSAALIIPEDAYTDTSLGLKLKLFYDPKNDIEMQVILGMLQKTIFENIPSVFYNSMKLQSENYLGKAKGNEFNTSISNLVSKYFNIPIEKINTPDLNNISTADNDSNKFNIFDNILKLEKTQLVGEEIVNPNVTRGIGGWALMFLLFSITASAASLFDEKKSGVMIRILTTTVNKNQILWSKYLFNMFLGVTQISLLFIIGSLIYKIDIISNIWNLLIVIFASSIACTAFGMFLSSISKTSIQANGWGTFLILTMSAVGGAWFPTFLMPEYVQFFSKLTLVYWSVEGFLNVLWRNSPFTEILTNVFILLGMALFINIISIWRFNKGNIFN